MIETPTYFQPLEVPRFCYIWEAVLWAGFGRFPDGTGYIIRDVSPGDSDEGWKTGTLSFNWKEPLFRQEYRFDGFWGFEAIGAGLTEESTDWARYDAVLSHHGYIRPGLIVDEIARLRTELNPDDNASPYPPSTSAYANYDPADGSGRRHYLENLEKRLSGTPFLDSVHRLFQRQIDLAWVRIFQALVDGGIVGFGWRELSQAEIRGVAASQDGVWEQEVFNPWKSPMPVADLIGPLVPMAVFEAIPASDWSLSGIAPDAHYQSASGRFWWNVIFAGDALFKLFPKPILAPVDDKTNVEHVTPLLAISTADSISETTWPVSNARVGPGKRKKANGEIERLCQRLYGPRLLAGEKELALAAEAAELAFEVWGDRLGRSTFQDYMKPFKSSKAADADGVPDIVPDIAAE